MQSEGHVSRSRHDGKVVLSTRRESVRLKKNLSRNSSDHCKVEEFIAKQVKPKSAKKISTAFTSGVRCPDHGLGDDPTSDMKQQCTSKAGNRVVSLVNDETMTKPESDKEKINTRISSESLEETTMMTGSRDESHVKQEMETGVRVESSDKRETMIKIGSRIESLDKEEMTTKTGSKVKSHEKAEKRTGTRVESHDKENTMIKTGSRDESHNKEDMKTMAGVMTKATSRVDPLEKCAHGHLVCQCGICFRLINGMEMEVSSMRRGWHMCTICHMGFRDPVMHMNHFMKFHKIVAPPLSKCPICGARVEGNRIMEHMKLHEDTSVVQNRHVSHLDSSVSHTKSSKVKTHKSSDASSAISMTVDSSRLMNCIHTRTASKQAREKLTGVTSDCVKEQGEKDGSSYQTVLSNSNQEASAECKEVIPGSTLCHICGADIENIAFEEHMKKHDKEITLDPDVSDAAHGTLRNTQVQLCHLCGSDVSSDVFEQHVKQHENLPLTSSHDIACKLSSRSDNEQLVCGISRVEPCDLLENQNQKIPSSSGNLELPSSRGMCSEEAPVATPTDIERNELKYIEDCKEQLRLVKQYAVGCCYHQKDQEENADHWLFNEMCGWHMCGSCNMGFHGHQLYWEHLLEVHNVVKPSTNVCPTCGSTVQSEDLPMHMTAHERDESYVENDPGFLDDKRFPCLNCSKCFSSFTMFMNHIKEHNQVVSVKELPLDFHWCNVCGTHVLGEDNLSAHISLHQAVECPNDCCTSLFRCKICSISFPSNNCFMRHMERWHRKQFYSNMVTKLNFNKHAVTVYKCVCYSLFVDILDFKRHVQKKHPKALREQMRTEEVEPDMSEGMMVDDVSGHTQKLTHTKTTQANYPDIDLKRKSNKGMILDQEKESTERALSKELTCRDAVSVQMSSESHTEHQDIGASSCPSHLQHEEVSFSDRHCRHEKDMVSSTENKTKYEDKDNCLMQRQLPKTDGSFRGLTKDAVSGGYKRCCKPMGAAVKDKNNAESDSSFPIEMDSNSCSSSETADAGKDGTMNLVLRMPQRSEFCSASKASNIQYVVGRDSSFRVVRKQSGKAKSKYSKIENMLTLDIEEKVSDLEMEVDNCWTKTDTDQVGDRNTTQNSSIVGVDPAVDGGAQDVAVSMNEVNASGATSSIDPSSVKGIRCDKEGAMVKVFREGVEGCCSCTQCGRIFRNENDFVMHCKVTMTHKILRTVYRKNLSVRNRAESEGMSESTCKSDTHKVASTGGSDVSLNLCSCGKLLVGQEDLDRHLQAYRLRVMMCDCGTQTSCDGMSCQGHTALVRLRDRNFVRQLDKCVMVDEEDINATFPLFFDENMDDTDSVVETKESGVDSEKVNCIRGNGPTVSNCTKEKEPSLSDDTVKKEHSASNSNEENGPSVSDMERENGPDAVNSSRENRPSASNISGENGPSASNISGENGPSASNNNGQNGPSIINIKGENRVCASNISGENGPSASNINGENGPPCVSNFGERTTLFDTDSNTGSDFLVKRESPARVISGVSFGESLLASDSTQKDCSSGSFMMSSSSSNAPGKVRVHMCSLCHLVLLQKEDMVHHLSCHKSYICLCSVFFLDFASFMCHAQKEHKMCASDQNPVFVNLLGPKPQIIARTQKTDKIFDSLNSENLVSSQSDSAEMLGKDVKLKGYFTCECHEIFVTETDYHDHLRQVISKGKHGRKAIEEWYHCAICPMAFATKLDYMLHLKREHRKKGHPTQMAVSSQKTSAMVRCEDCGIKFNNMAGLKVHQRLYQGTFKCTHRQDQVRAEITRGRLADLGVSLRVDMPGIRGTKDSAMLASKNDSQSLEMGTKDSAMLASKNDSQSVAMGTKDSSMLASKNDSQSVEMGIPIPDVEVGTAVKHDLNPDSTSEFTMQKKIDTCAKTCEVYVIGSDGKIVIKTESGAENTLVASDSFIITRNDDEDEDDVDDDEDDDDGEDEEEDADGNRHDAIESDRGGHGDVNPSEIIMPGFGFMGSDATKWTMMVPMVTVKKEPEECMESVHGCQSVLGGRDTDEDVKTEVKVEPAAPETGITLMGNGVEPDWMLAMSCGDGEDQLDSVQVKEEPVSDEELSQTAVGNMVYIHKSSQDIFDEHERQPPETQEQLVSLGTVGSLKHIDEEQQVPQQYSLAQEKSVKQQLVAKLKIIRQQRELAKQQSEKQQPIAKLKTVKQQLLAKRQLAKHQRLGLMPEPVKEEPPTEKLQPKETKQQETPQPAVEQLTAKQPWIKIQPKPQTVESSLSVTNEQSLVMRHEQPRIQMHPLIKLQQAAQQQPMVKLKAMAQQQPVVKLQAVTQQQPMVKPKTVAPQQPLVKHQAARQLQMMVKLKAVEKQPMVKLQEATQQQPVVKLQAAAQQQMMVKLKSVDKHPMVKLQEATQQQPVVKLQAETQQQMMVKLKAVEKEPMVKLQEATQQQPMVKLKTLAPKPQTVIKLQSLIQQQTGTKQKQLFKFHVVKCQGSPQQEVVKPKVGPPSLYECGICSNTFKTPEALIVHVKTHSKKMHQLNNLIGGSLSFSMKVALERKNALQSSSTDKSYGCPVCKETFLQSSQLLGHLQTHQVQKQGNVTMCIVCGSQFKQASSLRKHMHCHMRESGKGLTELVAKVDPALMPVAEAYPCEQCDLVFRSKNRKAVHVRYVHKQMAPNKCVLCEKNFYSPSELERHMRTHTGEKPFGCDQCGKAFALSTTLKDHLRSHTGERPFKCSICFKAYSSSSILGRHKLTHVGERKFKCDICDKSFLYSNSLTVHMRTHTGDRPFTCNICGKTFTASCHYRVHMRIHTGEKPYKCTFCEKQFNNYGSHYRHVRTHQEWKFSREDEEDEQEDIPEVLEVKQEVTSIDSGDEGDLERKLVPFMLSSALKTNLLQTQGVPDKSQVKEAKQKPKLVSLLAPRTTVADGSTVVSAGAGASKTAVASCSSLLAGAHVMTSAQLSPQDAESKTTSAPSAAVAEGSNLEDQSDQKTSVQLSTQDSNPDAHMYPVKGSQGSVILELSEPDKSGKAVHPSHKQHIQKATVYTKVITTQPSQLPRSELAPPSVNKNLKRTLTGPTTSPWKTDTVKRRKTETGPIQNKSLSTSSTIAQLLLSQTNS